jgi:exo-1,4-beta-D-glucosaminidase
MRRTIQALSAALLYLAVNTVVAATITPLHTGWNLQSACKIQDDGAALSTTSYKTAGWIPTQVPSTVLAAQVAAKLTKDVDYGTNLRDVPGTTYPIGANFSGQPMPQDSPYKCGWWYRKTFTIPVTARNKTLWLRFAAINYRADIWINGKLVADKVAIQGAFTAHELNVTPYLIAGKENTLAVETFAPTPDDLAIAWADWNPMPPDKEMGLWGDVDLVATGPVEITSPAVTTHFSDTSLKEADLSVYAEVKNSTDKPISGTLTATLEGVQVKQSVELSANETKSISFTPDQFEKLKIKNPRIWWPWQMGQPNLETLKMTFTADGRISDEESIRYGIREITSELIDRSTKGADIVAAKYEPLPPPEKPRAPRPANAPNPENRPVAPRPKAPEPPPQQVFSLYRVNGKPILVRGGGWAPDMLLRNDPAKLRAEFRMVRDMGLNTIR